jgi:hypothetical protein
VCIFGRTTQKEQFQAKPHTLQVLHSGVRSGAMKFKMEYEATGAWLSSALAALQILLLTPP